MQPASDVAQRARKKLQKMSNMLSPPEGGSHEAAVIGRLGASPSPHVDRFEAKKSTKATHLCEDLNDEG